MQVSVFAEDSSATPGMPEKIQTDPSAVAFEPDNIFPLRFDMFLQTRR